VRSLVIEGLDEGWRWTKLDSSPILGLCATRLYAGVVRPQDLPTLACGTGR
jgi:hypothetical protein